MQPSPLESTAVLLESVRRGDRAAVGRLVERYKPVLLRFAHGRLPRRARRLVDTEDIVITTLEKSLKHLETFEWRHEGSFHAYLRRAVLNRIYDEIRKAARAPEQVALHEHLQAFGPSPLEEVLGKEAMERYEAALQVLSLEQREAVVLRLEGKLSYREIAEKLGSPSANSVRMSIGRGLAKMAKHMTQDGSR